MILFENVEQFAAWRNEQSKRFYFEYGLESARAAILAAAQVDRPRLVSDWDQCRRQQHEGAASLLSAWITSLEASTATVIARWSGLTEGAPATVEVVSQAGLAPGDETLLRSASNGRTVLDRVIVVQRQSSGDLQIQVRSNDLSAGVAVPEVSGINVDQSRLIRKMVSFQVESVQGTLARCVTPETRMQFDLVTLQVRSSGNGAWSVVEKSPNRICVQVTGFVRFDPFKPRLNPTTVEVRVTQVGAL